MGGFQLYTMYSIYSNKNTFLQKSIPCMYTENQCVKWACTRWNRFSILITKKK